MKAIIQNFMAPLAFQAISTLEDLRKMVCVIKTKNINFINVLHHTESSSGREIREGMAQVGAKVSQPSHSILWYYTFTCTHVQISNMASGMYETLQVHVHVHVCIQPHHFSFIGSISWIQMITHTCMVNQLSIHGCKLN